MMSLPEQMTVIAVSTPGAPEVLKPEQRPVPKPEGTQILVRVLAAGVNRPDVMQRQGKYPPPPGAPDYPGLEIAGEVAALGANAKRWKLGDKVCALVAGGGYAEYAIVDESNALPVPKGFSFTEAAALPETFFTVWHNVFERGRLRAGETLLLHGGSSGIGTTAIMLAKAFGAKVIVTAGSKEKCDACVKLGADVAVDYKTQDFVALTKEHTGGKGADLIVDMVGGPYVDRNLDAAAVEGRIVQIATQQGFKVEMNLIKIMSKRLTYTGSTLRPRPVADKAAIAAALLEKAWPLLDQGKIRPVIDSTFPLAEAAKAHARMESSGHVGKIVLTAG
ncbi:MAG: NAD(P)H-quinone oxidoreductase [Xanthobacteraceae bacterium]|nr:NAD(P)H-quinone oxidoreductase [Xanthobacteraceae bacterium]QYK46698.1 MAG: NAD(P)H-quinone oxidoreductase [Xanthobacteraceae bacterium]HMN51393.1 NAD(P)H-quinone oxidoreductase [Xanthobacteraceae bacterium]